MALKVLWGLVVNPLVQMAFMKNKNEELAAADIEELQAEINEVEKEQEAR